ncbi:MAG TPA: formate dehydrogenase accessory protein FdhE [Bryobacteraceae bacterium]|nr:formate dehydrogenase accessory protein FdhE [Bryobacteraceae bacterium]
MTDSRSDRFDKRIARARGLAAKYPESAKLLEFYSELVAFQKTVFAELDPGLGNDVRRLAKHFPGLLELVKRAGPDPLNHFAQDHLETLEAREELLARFWNRTEETNGPAQFFARVLMQPYAERLASLADLSGAASHTATCPFCGAKPVAAVRRGEGDGARRSLLCSLCSLEWPYRRILCPGCGEEQKDKLPVFLAAGIDHVLVEACDTCRTYLKSVDLTKQGFAIPEVDELATVAIDVWAEENGYSKLETNLLGM